MHPRNPALPCLLAVALPCALAPAQPPCGSSLQALEISAGLDGALYDSILWDRDGSGPLAAELVIGGAFRRVGGVVVNGVARQDAVLGWQALGDGVDGIVRCLAIDGSNRLVVGGTFANAGLVATPRIARFDGTQWSALTSPPPALTGPITALAPRGAVELNYVDNGGLGYFDGAATYGIPLTAASGSFGASALDVARLPNGDLLVAGSFSAVAGQPANNLAVVEGNTGVVRNLQGGTNALVRSVDVSPSGDFLVFGAFTTAGGAASPNVARWTASGWQTYPSPMLLVDVLGGCTDGAGEPVVFGTIGVRQFVGGAWQTLSSLAVLTVHARALPDGTLLFGTTVTANATTPEFGYLLQNGVASPLAAGANGAFQAAAEMPDGSIVGYLFTNAGMPALTNQPAPGGFVRRTASGAWHPEPTGLPPRVASNAMAQIAAILPQRDGSYVVAGGFTTIGGGAITGIARFDGSAWQPLGAGPGGPVARAAQLANGDLVVLSGAQSLRRFDGATWQTLSPSAAGTELAACRDGSFVTLRRVVAGTVTNHLDRWTGSTRTSVLIPGTALLQGVAELRDGSIAIAATTGVTRYDGATFQAVGALTNPNATAVAARPDGSIVANLTYGGNGTPSVRTTMRWDGANWSALHASGGTKPVPMRNGDVLVLGAAVLDGARAAAIARFATGCPSASNAVASGCATGAATLASDAPWVGQTLRLEATGLPLAAFAIAVGSTQSANLPLAGVFATAIPGCTLLVQPDVTSTQLAVAGKAQLAFAIPNTPALAGAAFREQFVHFALDPSLAVGATNALDLVVGSY